MKDNKIVYVILALVAIAIIVWLGFFLPKDNAQQQQIVVVSSFEDCVKAGLPIMESYPRQCKTPDGNTFVEEITPSVTYTNATSNLITVSQPTPGATVGSSFTLSGQARGNWYFEASFPIQVLDTNQNVLVNTFVMAQGEWMTEDFVPFNTTITVPNGYTGPATLVLHKDNASGLPEHDASISFPITISN